MKDNLFGLGQGAFVAKNDDVVVRKDYKVLLVDVKNVPKGASAFVPAMVRPDVATNIAVGDHELLGRRVDREPGYAGR